VTLERLLLELVVQERRHQRARDYDPEMVDSATASHLPEVLSSVSRGLLGLDARL
jgi:hypothetical protein